MSGEQIVLIPQSVNGGPVQWTMVHDGFIGNGRDYPPVILPKDGKNHDITFTIVDINKLGIKFDPAIVNGTSKPKAINGIWIVEGSASQKKAGPYPDQFDTVKLQSSGTQLVVGDKNSNDEVYTYQLNFVGPVATQPITPIDPEIRNGGGTMAQYFTLESAALLLLGVTVLILAGVQWLNFRRR